MTVKLGVVGVGAIATYMVKGLLSKSDKNISIYLSPRGRENVKELVRLFPDIREMPTNQAVLDEADWVLLAVRPHDAEQVASALRFSPRHKVLSVVATLSVERLKALMPGACDFVRMVPLPFIERRSGPLVIYPGDAEVLALFDGLGQPVVPQDEPSLEALSGITSSMSPFYRMVGQVAEWGMENGLSTETAVRFTVAFYSALLDTCALTPAAEVGDLWREMTPGGLNARATEVMEAAGGFSIWSTALNEVIARIRQQGKT